MPHRHDPIEISSLLSRLPLFQAVKPEHIAILTEQTRKKPLARGEILFHRGDIANGVYLVIYGQIKLAFPGSNGNEKVVDIVGPQQCFGEAVMFIDRPYPVFAQALADCLLLHIAKHSVFALLEKDSSFARQMLAGLSMRNHLLVQDVETYSLHSSMQRVIGFLLQHCPGEKLGHCDGGVSLQLPTSKQVIASRLNLTPETFSRILTELVAAKLIRVQGRLIHVLDLKRLREHDL